MHVICSLCNQGCRNTHTFRMVAVWHGAWFLRVGGCHVILIDFKPLLQRSCAASGVVRLTLKTWKCCCSVAKSSPTLCNPMDCSMSGFPVFHYLLEFAQIHVHWVSDAIQPFHPVTPFSICSHSFPASGSFPMSWLFTSGSQSIGALASHQSFQWIFRTDFLWDGLVGSPCSPGTLKSLP